MNSEKICKIFISYRREDSAGETGRIYDRLVSHFGKEAVFKDVDDIPIGFDFRDTLHDALSNCSLMIIIIGKTWLESIDTQGKRRIDDPNDFVRIELEFALSMNLPIIPVTLANVSIPLESELPETIGNLACRQGIQIRHDPDFNRDMDKLIWALQKILKIHDQKDNDTEVEKASQVFEIINELSDESKLEKPNKKNKEDKNEGLTLKANGLFDDTDGFLYWIIALAFILNLISSFLVYTHLRFGNINFNLELLAISLIIYNGYKYGKKIGATTGITVFFPNFLGHLIGYTMANNISFRGDFFSGQLSINLLVFKTYFMTYPLLASLGYLCATSKEVMYNIRIQTSSFR